MIAAALIMAVLSFIASKQSQYLFVCECMCACVSACVCGGYMWSQGLGIVDFLSYVSVYVCVCVCVLACMWVCRCKCSCSFTLFSF